MINKWQQNAARTFLAIAIITFLLMGVFGLPHFGMTMTMSMENMDMDGNSPMTNCYMPGMATYCNMSPLEHIAGWQSMFTSVPTQNLALALLLLVCVAVAGFTWIRQRYAPPQELRAFSRFSQRRKYVPLVTHLQELFSDGILNPKLF